MGKNKENLNVRIESDGDEIKVTLSEEVKTKIPRPGDFMYIVQPYPADDEDADTNGNAVNEDVILAYSYNKKMVKGSVLTDEMDAVRINGDFLLPLNSDMSLQTKKLMVFTKEADALDKYRTLMNASAKEARRLEEEAKRLADKYAHCVGYLEEALEKVHH